PNMTIISESWNSPASTSNLKSPRTFCILGYLYEFAFATDPSVAVSAILKVKDSSRKRKFSVGMLPSKKILIPSRTE
ncbi:uncharacterized protein BX663DRAFT_436437, partial [Cokeromyces recurvatus]|uniref:uncharacterized protein n=1 Tax=Cokeromyces recurvatus TaxID=90255 RepID=UPI00221EB47D